MTLINLALGVAMLVVIGLVVWSYFADSENEMGRDLSKKKFVLLMVALGSITLYLFGSALFQIIY